MRAILLALALIPFAPAAAADDVCAPLGLPVTACVSESSYAEGECGSGGFEAGSTAVLVSAPGVASASVVGSYYCYGNDEIGGGEERIQVDTSGPVAMSFAWVEFYYSDPKFGENRYCFFGSGFTFQECPGGVAPPNPGWGSLLP